jgi:hypothetical protein
LESSFFDLESQRLHVEVWDMENFYLNEFIAYGSIPLVDIISGQMEYALDCLPYEDNFKEGKKSVSLNMQIILSEIWDFKLDFMDWKTTNLGNRINPMENLDPQLTLVLRSNESISSTISST